MIVRHVNKLNSRGMKKQIFLMAIIIALVSVSTFGQNARKYFKAGSEFFDGMKYDDAIAHFFLAYRSTLLGFDSAVS